MKKLLTTLSEYLWHMARFVCLVAMIILTPVVFVNIILRFVFGYSLGWSSEVARYAFIWLTFCGMAVALKDDSHAKIELLLQLAPPELRKWINTLGQMVIIILSIILIVSGIQQTIMVWGVNAAYMRFLSMGWMYLSIPLSGFFMLIFTLVNILKIWENHPETPGDLQ